MHQSKQTPILALYNTDKIYTMAEDIWRILFVTHSE
jgi:hypothetical protein